MNPINSNNICIYHGNCADGFAAAWVVRKYFAQIDQYIQMIPGVYQEAPPDVTGALVFLVDFSYKAPVLRGMAQRARHIMILDHHKTAQEEILSLGDVENITSIFDMNRSGAMITWEHFFPNIEPPRLIEHIQDRDLWKFELPKTREIQACVFSYPYLFSAWDELMYTDLSQLITEGEAIERKHFKDIAELLPIVTRPMKIAGHTIEVANLPYIHSSDAGHTLAEREGNAFGACYWDTPSGRVFSLRSTDDKEDVSAIAKQYGGGGHRNAAGFRVSYEEARTFELSN